MKVADFPLMTKTASQMNRLARFEDAVQAFDEALELNEIRNSDYQDIKDTFGRIVERCWSDNVRQPFFYAGKYEDLPQEIREFDWKVGLVSNLHNVIAASKKVEATKLQSPVIEAMRNVTREILPLAEASAKLKNLVVKGRAPNPNPKPENPNKIVRTCPCCFRDIAVTGVTMAHHGYERPGNGYQTDSCPGIRFEPAERSDAGIRWMVEQSERNIASLTKQRTEADQQTSISLFNHTKNRFFEVKLGDEKWAKALASWKHELESQIRQWNVQLDFFNEKLKNWEQKEPSLLEPVADVTFKPR